MRKSVKRKYKSEKDTVQAKRRARHAAARETASQQETALRRALDASIHVSVREAESQQQTATRLASDASRHNAMRCNESDQQTTSRRQNDEESHRLFIENRQMSKKDYLFAFNSSLYGPLHVQPFVSNHMKAFHFELGQLKQQQCQH